jgi:hypothetical protein
MQMKKNDGGDSLRSGQQGKEAIPANLAAAKRVNAAPQTQDKVVGLEDGKLEARFWHKIIQPLG